MTVFSLKVAWPGNYHEDRGKLGLKLKTQWREQHGLNTTGKQPTRAQLLDLNQIIQDAYKGMMIDVAEQSEQAQWCRDTNTPYEIRAGASFQYQPTALLELHINDPRGAMLYKLTWHNQ